MTDKEKAEKMNELMNKISFALKDATLQQGFEIICKRIAELEKENEEQVALIETQYAENQTLGNNNAKLLQMYGESQKENAELKIFCKKLIKTNNELRDSLRKYEVVPDVDYLPNGSEVYKENVGDNPYDIK